MSVHPTDRAYEKLIDVYHAEVIPGFRKITDYVHQYDTTDLRPAEPQRPAVRRHASPGCRSGRRAPSPTSCSGRPRRRWSRRTSRRSPATSPGAPSTCAKGASTGSRSSSATPAWRASSSRRSPTSAGRVRRLPGEPDAGAAQVHRRGAQGGRQRLHPRHPHVRRRDDPRGGLDLAQVQEIGARFEASGLIDFMDLSIATFYNLYLVEGSMHTPLGYTIPLAAGIARADQAAGLLHRPDQRPGHGGEGAGRRPGRHDRHVPRADLRPVPPQEGLRGAAGGHPLLHRRQPGVHRPHRGEQAPRLHPEPGGGRGEGVGRRDPGKGAP